jgi:hypothetical protein
MSRGGEKDNVDVEIKAVSRGKEEDNADIKIKDL